MKKLLLFGAALFAAVAINATDYSTIASEADYTIANAQVNAEETEKSEGKKVVYDITGGQVLEFYVNADPSIVFSITNSADKAKIFIVNFNSSVEFGGKDGLIKFSNLQSGKTYKVTAAAKGSKDATIGVIDTDGKTFIGESLALPAKAKGADGADDQGYIWKDFTFTATSSEMTIKETTGGIRVSFAGPADGSGLVNLEGENAVKDGKFMQNGQIYIRKNGKVFNILGAQVAE